MRFFDAHNHLQDARLNPRQDELVETAAREGLARMVVNGACEEDWALVQALAEKHHQVLPSFGYHPWYLHERTPEWRQQLTRFLDAVPSAVGEIGLDRWKPGLPYDGQEEAFTWQLSVAAERNVAASIHCLQAWGRLVELLESTPRPARGFLLHSYGGSRELVERVSKLGAYFSFPGYFMHERKMRQREAFQAVPLDRLLIETDAPDQLLPASANRFPLHDAEGAPLNHPANIAAIYEFVAKERGMSVVSLAVCVEENFHRLFGR